MGWVGFSALVHWQGYNAALLSPDDSTSSAVVGSAGPWVQVALGVVTRPLGQNLELLISQRKPEQVLSGYWEFPGGKIEPSETPAQCVERELLEEVGLIVQAHTPLPTIDHHYPHASVRLHPYLCRHLAGQARPLRVAACRWVLLSDLPEYHFPPANASLLANLPQTLRR